MAMTNAERQKRYRITRRQTGGARLDIVVSAATKRQIERVQAATGFSVAAVIEAAIAAYVQSHGDDKPSASLPGNDDRYKLRPRAEIAAERRERADKAAKRRMRRG